MQKSRRTFLKWTATLGLVPFLGVSLFAEPVKIESIGSTDMDDLFDPDGWL